MNQLKRIEGANHPLSITWEDIEAHMSVGVVASIKVVLVLLVTHNIRFCQNVDPTDLRIVFDVVLQEGDRSNPKVNPLTLHDDMMMVMDFSPSPPFTYVFALAGIQADKIWIVASEVRCIDFKGLQVSSGSQFNLDPVMVSLNTRTTRLPSVTSVESTGWEDKIRGFAVSIIACLDHLGAAGKRSEIENRVFVGEDGRYVSKNTQTSLTIQTTTRTVRLAVPEPHCQKEIATLS
jgi:hypothetical protein